MIDLVELKKLDKNFHNVLKQIYKINIKLDHYFGWEFDEALNPMNKYYIQIFQEFMK